MPDEAFQDAKKAAEGTPDSFWKYTMYRGPAEDGTLDAKVKVHYCTSSRTTERVIKQYFMNEKVLGLDLEWVSNALKSWGPRKNVSLIQLASPSRIGLFHIAAFPAKDTLVAPSLKKLLEDPEITKVGVWIKGDCTRLQSFLDIKTRGQFELSHLYKLVKYSKTGEHNLVNKKLVALSTQVKETLGLPLFKGSDVRTSDWTKPLNMNQIIYSSSDAYATVQAFAVLNHQRENLESVPPLPHHAELNLPIETPEIVVPEATEEQEPDPEAAVEDSAAIQDQAVPEAKTALEDTLVREDGPAPEDEPVSDAQPDAGNMAPKLEKLPGEQITPAPQSKRDGKPSSKTNSEPPSNPGPRATAELNSQP
ncbi:hypothetical protein NEMBOFW57_005909 [Staphylotrichum longicolle]|uniref:3'-5' exonuclease domain-containing protein n=1 Tax=Staphylotrichum longicolle TaxID=669026 RepID=A0AAD4F2C2_9PEZI|nr:hypothetical protein NEMBOFW57_005909 [Staphylotrichum longicolle]